MHCTSQRSIVSTSALRSSTPKQGDSSKSDPSTSPIPPPKKTSPSIPVDSLCIPLTPPYSLLSYLPTSPPPLSRETLLKLHRLSALEPPQTEQEWDQLKGLDGLVALVEGVRSIDTSSVPADSEAGFVDARIRAKPTEHGLDMNRHNHEDIASSTYLGLASTTRGAYYVVPTPENVRGKKSSKTSDLGVTEIE
ncbi:BZ3500_MvSof-1268-A1-R1_Chr7-1g09312 [Microbotryum saponariae]|uniref:BZ3500_MvSof-1268-A1-R1_Chr7-1g09312 protein n=1 Tax=Microbotryum saponariae TaxID=289078 RepID=A0A2X0KXM6_9BASI|nr:BZ3501_MvSof-1269-A2-R1_Chr7-1g09017 [Microbotryum saponariae]SDA03213.1 BZ3500_MvSof-1268-A1-R1_Chr7-1g09312 [Microbotryum saponariae]